MFERFTDRSRKVMALANQEAQRFHHEYIGPEHILLGLVKEGNGVGATVLKNVDVDIKRLRREVEKLVEAGPDTVSMGKLPQTPTAKMVINYAIEEARALNHNYVGTEHLLLGLTREEEGVAWQVLMNMGLKLEDLRAEVLNLLGAGVEDSPSDLGLNMGPKVRSKTPALDSFARELTKLAADARLDTIVGRDAEIEKVTRILCRHQHNNPLLIGPPSVGKKTIVEELAQRITNMQVTPLLHDKRLLDLDLGLMIAGATSRDRVETRVKAVLNEVHRDGNTILLLDTTEFPLIVGSSIGYEMPLSSLGRAAHRGEAQLIVVATNKVHESAAGIASYLYSACTPIYVEAPDVDAIKDIIRAHRQELEAYHRIKIPDDSLDCIFDIVENRIEGRLLPGVVIDLIDEACAAASVNYRHFDGIAEMNKKIRHLEREKDECVRGADYDRAAALRDEAQQLLIERDAKLNELSEKTQILDRESIKQVLVSMTGCTLAEMENPNSPRIPAERVAGQDLSTVSFEGVSAIPANRAATSADNSLGLSAYECHQTESILQSEHVEIITGTGFVLLPHTQEFEDIFDQAISPAMEKNRIEAVKADNIYSPGAILSQVWDRIRSAEVVVADMSIQNPNVIYELGLCHGLHRCPILLVRDPANLPFNLRSLRYIVYENTPGGVHKMSGELTRAIEEFLAATRSPSIGD